MCQGGSRAYLFSLNTIYDDNLQSVVFSDYRKYSNYLASKINCLNPKAKVK